MSWDNLLSLVAGWILGLLSSIITDKRKRRSQKKEVKRGILTELQETQIILIFTCDMLTQRFGGYDRNFLTWILPYFRKFGESDSSSQYDNNIKFVNDTLALTDEEIKTQVEELRRRNLQQEGSKSGLTLKTMLLPYADSKISSLPLFKEDFQRQVLSIKRDTNAMNEDIELAWWYFKKTFESLSDKNYQLIDANLNKTYLDLAGKTRRLADKIQKLLSENNP